MHYTYGQWTYFPFRGKSVPQEEEETLDPQELKLADPSISKKTAFLFLIFLVRSNVRHYAVMYIPSRLRARVLPPHTSRARPLWNLKIQFQK